MNYLIGRTESIFVDIDMIHVDFIVHNSEFIKVVEYVYVVYVIIYLTNIHTEQIDVPWKLKKNFLQQDYGGSIILESPV